MRKSKLIALLNAVKGNPEVYLWNGFVEDFVDIEPVFQKDVLYKPLSWPGGKPTKWTLRNANVRNRELQDFYEKRTKHIILLDSKRRGEVSYDRLGKIEY